MAKLYIETYGCSLNQADSQAMVALLLEAKFEFVNRPEEADLIILNSCTVKTPTERKILKRLDELAKLDKPIVVAGCLPQATPTHPKLKRFSRVGVYQIPRIVEVVEEALHGNTMVVLARESYERLSIPHYEPNPVITIIPICQGCLGEPCSYCIVKQARGQLYSYPIDAIVKRVKESVSRGAKEVWLTAQDTGAYGKDINTNLPELLRNVLKVEGGFMVRLGMANPNHIRDFVDELIEILKSPKMFKFIHIPVQSGNNEVLKSMRRKYTVEEFIAIVEKFRKAIPNITIATDIICGFPGETKAQFEDSVNLVKEIKPDVLNISRFWPRPGTKAAKLKQLPGYVPKERSRLLTRVFNDIAFKNNLKWLGWEGRVIIDEQGNYGNWKGRNFAYKQVVINSDQDLLGKTPFVKVFDVSSHDLKAKVVQRA